MVLGARNRMGWLDMQVPWGSQCSNKTENCLKPSNQGAHHWLLILLLYRVNACRLARLVTRPVVSHLTDQLWDFENSCAIYMHSFPQLAGHTIGGEQLKYSFEKCPSMALLGQHVCLSRVLCSQLPQRHATGDVSLRFADGIVLGVLEGSTGFVLVNPPAAYTLNEDEQVILLRPTNVTQVSFK
eukprot:GHUV01045966.1.p1 GENE.GHUV01045966.1~~GHUV01045966.1.p1  ORF type:complete len:184 (+),score=16.32 GHUV01045966.1:695-1246(+)